MAKMKCSNCGNSGHNKSTCKKRKSCRHKWSDWVGIIEERTGDWKYGGSFEDGYTKTCEKCYIVKAG